FAFPHVPAALHTFTLDSGASRCFFRDSTTLTPLSAPVLVSLADPSSCPVLARSSTVLPCPTVPSGSLSCLHLPSFSTNLVSTAALQDAMVTTTTPGGQRVSICTCTRTGRHLATFTRRPGSSLYTLATEPPQRAAPHSSSFPPTTAPLQTLHMDVWGPARVSGQGRERYFLLVVDDYTRYTTVFPLRSKVALLLLLLLLPLFCTAAAPTATMASPTVLTFDTEGRAVDFDVWVNDLQLFLQCDSRDGVSLFDHTSGVSTSPAATADSTVRSQWTTRDTIARLAVR
ncbi:unnamed protein product, partial [Closterium sp. NIES-53]